jgi:hypothetical protein
LRAVHVGVGLWDRGRAALVGALFALSDGTTVLSREDGLALAVATLTEALGG